MRYFCIPLILFVVSCANIPTPQTMRENYVAAESSYKAAILTVSDLNKAGTIKSGTSTARSVATAVRSARSGLDAWGGQVDSHEAQIAEIWAVLRDNGMAD